LEIDLNIAANDPAQLLESLPERSGAELSFGIVLGVEHQHADPPHPIGLLCVRRQRPRSRRAAEERDELAAPHSRTSLARAMNTSDKEMPSEAAVLRLTPM
jgi:hypothetical protein